MFDTLVEVLPGLAAAEGAAVSEAVSDVVPEAVFDAGLDEDRGLADLSGVELGRLVEANARELRVRESRQLRLAVAWADLHDADPGQPFSPLVERASMLGGEGTPAVSEFCVAEFAALQALSFTSGRALIADALDARHRLPRLWQQMLAAEVRGWKARKIADATRCLSWEAAADVDHAISGLVESVPWPRFEKILGAAILEADPELMRQREVRARTERRVWASDADDGLKTLVAKADAGDVTWFMAAVNRIADILKVDGDPDLVGVRRAKAVGILAQPAVAIQLLAAHANDPDVGPDVAPGDPVAGPDEAPPVNGDLLDSLLDEREPDAPETEPPARPEDNEGRLADLVDEPAQEPVEEPVDAETVPVADLQLRAETAHTSLDVTVPEGLSRVDPTWLRPRVVLYFHLAEAAIRDGHGLARPEHGGPLTLDQLREWLTRTGCTVQVRPVLIPAEVQPVDGYQIPTRVREAVRLREVADVWPYGTCTTATMDVDHTTPYRPMIRGGPPGQTGPDTLGPLPPDPAPGQNPRPVERPTTQPRNLPVAIPQRLGLFGHQPRDARSRQDRLQPRRLASRRTGPARHLSA